MYCDSKVFYSSLFFSIHLSGLCFSLDEFRLSSGHLCNIFVFWLCTNSFGDDAMMHRGAFSFWKGFQTHGENREVIVDKQNEEKSENRLQKGGRVNLPAKSEKLLAGDELHELKSSRLALATACVLEWKVRHTSPSPSLRLPQQMDQRCASHWKSGDLNNSATSCLTSSVVQLSLSNRAHMERQTFLAQKNANLTGEVPKETPEEAGKRYGRTECCSTPSRRRYTFTTVCECQCVCVCVCETCA